MSDEFILVVGDKFCEFAAGKGVVTMSQLRGLLAVPHLICHPVGRVVIAPGQGLSEEDIAEVLRLTDSGAHVEKFDFSLWQSHSRRAEGRLTHKHHLRNTLISEPRRIKDDLFELDLLIDDGCELMGDHQTGQHVQGMILAEAARQSVLAVSETFFREQDGKKYYYVLDEMALRYKRFMFPLPAQLHYLVREHDRRRFVVDVSVEQSGEETATCTIGFTMFEAGRIARRESDLAASALDACVQGWREARNGAVAEAA